MYVGDRCKYYTGTEDVEVELVEETQERTQLCGDPQCCGYDWARWDVRMPDGTIENVAEYELDPL